jgi:hypothetical protein
MGAVTPKAPTAREGGGVEGPGAISPGAWTPSKTGAGEADRPFVPVGVGKACEGPYTPPSAPGSSCACAGKPIASKAARKARGLTI